MLETKYTVYTVYIKQQHTYNVRNIVSYKLLCMVDAFKLYFLDH